MENNETRVIQPRKQTEVIYSSKIQFKEMFFNKKFPYFII